MEYLKKLRQAYHQERWDIVGKMLLVLPVKAVIGWIKAFFNPFSVILLVCTIGLTTLFYPPLRYGFDMWFTLGLWTYFFSAVVIVLILLTAILLGICQE